MATARYRIGELSRRTGVSPALLRAWEQRYGLLAPERTPGGTRLYSDGDVERVTAMRARIAAGVSAAAAAAEVRSAPGARHRGSAVADPHATAPRSAATEFELAADELRDALARLDRVGADGAFSRLLRLADFETLVAEVILPYLGDVGERWSRGAASIAEEHLATQVLRSRILALADGLVPFAGLRAVLACPPEERHDLALVILAVALERRGWQVTLLGADTPVASLADAARAVDADAVVLAATSPERFDAVAGELTELARSRTVLLAGPGARGAALATGGPVALDGDPLRAAATIATRVNAPAPA